MNMSIGLTFPGALQDESIICYICKKFEVNLNIIEASFSFQKGWAFLQIEGEEDEVNKTLSYLKEKGIHIEKLEKEA